jgi:hypothetical protein
MEQSVERVSMHSFFSTICLELVHMQRKACDGLSQIRTQEYTAVVCMAVRSLTALPLVVPPNRKLNELPMAFLGLSRE